MDCSSEEMTSSMEWIMPDDQQQQQQQQQQQEPWPDWEEAAAAAAAAANAAGSSEKPPTTLAKVAQGLAAAKILLSHAQRAHDYLDAKASAAVADAPPSPLISTASAAVAVSSPPGLDAKASAAVADAPPSPLISTASAVVTVSPPPFLEAFRSSVVAVLPPPLPARTASAAVAAQPPLRLFRGADFQDQEMVVLGADDTDMKWTKERFQGRECYGHYSDHNAALKWFRDQCVEHNVGAIIMSNNTPVAVAATVHDPKGTGFHFDESKVVGWAWQDMVAQLDEASLDAVLGCSGDSNPILGCSVMPRPKSYDHKMASMRREQGLSAVADNRIWDFVIHRSGGTGIRLHPQRKSTKIETYDIEGHAEEVPLPRKGAGRSDGKGTFRWYKDVGNKMTLKFDPKKK